MKINSKVEFKVQNLNDSFFCAFCAFCIVFKFVIVLKMLYFYNVVRLFLFCFLKNLCLLKLIENRHYYFYLETFILSLPLSRSLPPPNVRTNLLKFQTISSINFLLRYIMPE